MMTVTIVHLPPSTTEGIDTALFDADTDENVISNDAGYEYCVAPHSSGFQVRA